MHKVLIVVIVLFCLSGFTSCECISPICDINSRFTVVDKTTHQNLFFSSQPKYQLDSVYGTAKGLSSPFHFYTEDSTSILPSIYGSNVDTLYVYFNSVKPDTLLLTHKFSRHTYCCKSGTSTVSSVTDNGTSLTKTGDVFIIEK